MKKKSVLTWLVVLTFLVTLMGASSITADAKTTSKKKNSVQTITIKSPSMKNARKIHNMYMKGKPFKIKLCIPKSSHITDDDFKDKLREKVEKVNGLGIGLLPFKSSKYLKSGATLYTIGKTDARDYKTNISFFKELVKDFKGKEEICQRYLNNKEFYKTFNCEYWREDEEWYGVGELEDFFEKYPNLRKKYFKKYGNKTWWWKYSDTEGDEYDIPDYIKDLCGSGGVL